MKFYEENLWEIDDWSDYLPYRQVQDCKKNELKNANYIINF